MLLKGTRSSLAYIIYALFRQSKLLDAPVWYINAIVCSRNWGERCTLAKKEELSGTQLLYRTEATGFEPAISGLTGRHVRPLHHASQYAYIVPQVAGAVKNAFIYKKSCGSWFVEG